MDVVELEQVMNERVREAGWRLASARGRCLLFGLLNSGRLPSGGWLLGVWPVAMHAAADVQWVGLCCVALHGHCLRAVPRAIACGCVALLSPLLSLFLFLSSPLVVTQMLCSGVAWTMGLCCVPLALSGCVCVSVRRIH